MTTGAKKRADVLFSKIVRSRGLCQSCGTPHNLQCAHIVSRRYSATRTLEVNAFCLCAGCHMRFTEWPVEFNNFVLDRIGAGAYGILRAAALAGGKVDWEAEVVRLRAVLNEVAA